MCSFLGLKKALVPEQVQALTKSQLGVPSSYWKARRAAMKARDTTYGTDEESYQRMYSYMHMLEQSNPGTYTRIERDTEGRFKYAFVSLGVWRRAVPYLRKVSPSFSVPCVTFTAKPLNLYNYYHYSDQLPRMTSSGNNMTYKLYDMTLVNNDMTTLTIEVVEFVGGVSGREVPEGEVLRVPPVRDCTRCRPLCLLNCIHKG